MGISIMAWLSSLDPYWGSRDDSQVNMEMPMYQSVYTNGVSSYQTCCPTKAFTKG